MTQTATFTCNATGYDVSYQWTIGSGSFPNKVTDTNSTILVIPNVRSSDDNTYTCEASTEGGNITSNTAQLIVTGKSVIWGKSKILCEKNLIVQVDLRNRGPGSTAPRTCRGITSYFKLTVPRSYLI